MRVDRYTDWRVARQNVGMEKIRLELHLKGGPFDGMKAAFDGTGGVDTVDKILAGGCRIRVGEDTYCITKFNKDVMRGVGVWESETVLTE